MLIGDGEEVARPVPYLRRGRHGGGVLQTAPEPEPNLRPDGAADRGAAVHPPTRPHRIAADLHLARSTVGKVLARYRMPRLACLEQDTGLPVRKPAPHNYEHDRPGDLIHLDIKKLGRIPNGGGNRTLVRANG